MTQEHIKRIRLIYSIILSISLVIAGICLMGACVSIYRSGEKPFSPETVAAAFSMIAFSVYPALVLVLGSFILDFFMPTEKKKSYDKQYAMILRKLHEKNDVCASAQADAIAAEQKHRKLHWAISIVLLIIGSVVFLTYGMNPANFHQSQINASMISAMWVLLPCMAVPFAYGIFAAYNAKRSMQREIELIKQAVAAGCPKKNATSEAKNINWMQIGRLALLGVAIAILVYGFIAGGTADVLTKAINICTECVGLG